MSNISNAATLFLCFSTHFGEGTPGYMFKLFGCKILRMNLRLDQSDFCSDGLPGEFFFCAGGLQSWLLFCTLGSPTSSPPLAILPEKRSCWQCLCNNRWKIEINTSCFSFVLRSPFIFTAASTSISPVVCLSLRA